MNRREDTTTDRRATAMAVMQAAAAAWEAGAELRRRRERYKRFTYGDQWSDRVLCSDGRYHTMEEDALRQGRRPMSNNLIRRLVKCVVGRFRTDLNERGTIDDARYREISGRNLLEELDSRTLEEYLISGCAIQRVVSENRGSGMKTWVDNVSPSRFFVNSLRDPRCRDIEMVGMLHDMSIMEVIMRFAGRDPEKARQLRELYASMADCGIRSPLGVEAAGESFYQGEAGRCRVIEVWTLEAAERFCCHDPEKGTMGMAAAGAIGAIEKENKRRRARGRREIVAQWEVATLWHCRWLAPDGTLIAEHDSPYAHGEHPFVVKFYPMTDGEVHPLVEDVIDQQIYVNNLITMIDHVIGSSAKGALLFPMRQKSREIEWTEIKRMWAAPDAIIPYEGIPGLPEPRQVSANSTDIGARELLALEMKLFEDVSGIGAPLLGQKSSANISAERYEAEVRNASAAVSDLLLSFESFRQIRDAKIAGV